MTPDMPETSSPTPRRRRRRSTAGGQFIGAFAAILPAFACFLGGGTPKWAEGIVVGLLGIILLVRPPRLSLGWLTNVIFFAFVVLAAFTFLPAGKFTIPGWRTSLVDDFAVQLPDTVSAQPWISATCLLSLFAGMCWLYFVATQECDLRTARFHIRVFVLGMVALAGLAIILNLAHVNLPFWINQRNFGPFPNRNQTADVFGIATILVLACGQDDLRYSRKTWVFWGLALGVLVAAIVMNLSRTGIIILVGGSAIWIGFVAFQQRSSARIAVAASAILILLTALLVFGGQTLERLHLRGLSAGETAGISSDFRWKIFHDTFDLIRASPWCGIGLGNFDPVFALFRHESLNETRALHPESDWLWLWSEMGWSAVVLAGVATILLLWRAFPLKEGTNQRFRLAALLGAIIFVVHGIFDVSAHRVGSAYAGIFVLGLCLHRPLPFKASRVVPIAFRLFGLALFVTGVAWIYGVRMQAMLPGSVGASNAKKASSFALSGLNYEEAISQTNRGLEWAPLDWQLYFARALGEIGAAEPEQALEDFRRARFLEPNTFEVPLAEGKAWLSTNPVYAASAWREALNRTETGKQRLEVYAGMLNKASVESPALGKILAQVGVSQHDLILAYLNHVSGDRFNRELNRFRETDPDLRTLTETEKFAFFDLWSERGDVSALAQEVQRHPEWMEYAWLGVAKFDAANKDFKAAYQLTRRYGEAVAMPRVSENGTIEELQNRYAASPDNYAVGYALYKEQRKQGRLDDALVTARHFTERRGAPAYFHNLEAEAWAEKQNWERAWEAWLGYRKAIKK